MTNKANRVTEKQSCGRPVLHIHIPDSRPSWRRYGEGVANLEATINGAGVVSIVAEETAFASKAVGEKRDVTRGAMLDLDAAAALALRDFLNKHLG